MATVRAITNDELTLLRTAGQFSRLWLAIYQPNTVYTAILDAVPDSTDRVLQITYNTGSGTLANVKAEMTLWVGTTAGARDLGVCRIRKAPISGTFYIGMTSEIDWQSSCHLTVVDLSMPFPRVPKMDGGALKLDGDTAYSDQYAGFQPVPIMGTHAVVWLTGSTVDVSFDSTDSWVFGSSISSRSWSAPGASATSGMTTNTPTITYNATGNYRVYCTVTAANGKSYTGVRHVFVFSASALPYDVELTQSVSGDYSGGGWSFGARCHAGAEDIVPGALAILFAEDWYGTTKQSIGQVSGRENIICVGYIDGESIQLNPESSTVDFSVTGANETMQSMAIAPVTLNISTATPAAWNEMPGLSVDKAAWYLLHWQSNITALMDFYKSGDTRYIELVEIFDADLWGGISGVANRIFGNLGVDKWGRVFLQIEPQLVPLASRSWATVMTVTTVDWGEDIEIERNTSSSLAMFVMSGQYTGQYGGTNVYYSLGLGHVHARTGGAENIDQVAIAGQSAANQLAGLYVGWKNREFEFDFTLQQNNRMVDLFPNQYLAIAVSADETPRGISFSGNLIPRSIEINFSPDTGAITTTVQCEQETFEQIAIDGDIPEDAGVDDFDASAPPDFDMPDFEFSTDNLFPPSIENLNHPKVVAISSTLGVFYTEGFDAASPVWKAMNAGLDSSMFASATHTMVATPSGAVWLLMRGAIDRLYRASKLGGEWSLMADSTTLEGGYITALGVNPDVPEQIAVMAGATDNFYGPSRLWFGSSAGMTAGSSTFGTRPDTSTAVVYKDGNWYAFYNNVIPFSTSWAQKFSITGAAVSNADINTTVGQDNTVKYSLALPTKFFQWDGAGSAGYNTITTGLVATRFTLINPTTNPQGMAFSPTGTYAMGAVRTTLTPYLSTDGGASWSSVAGTLSTGADIWENCKDDNRWIFGGGSTLRLTTDRGGYYVEKSGNLGYIAGGIDILCIRFFE